MSSDYKDYYKTLGVEKNAAPDAIKDAYRKLARKYHPDMHPENRKAEMSEKFKEVNEAYEVLSDAKKKQMYDQLGPDWENGARAGQQGGQQRPDPRQYARQNPFGQGGANYASYGDPEQFSDFFQQIFGARGGRGGAARGGFGGFGGFGGGEQQDFEEETPESLLQLPLEEALKGGRKTLTIPLTEHCRSCGGSGRKGRTRCPACGGAGRVSTSHNVTVNFPPGIADGARLRLKGQGPDGADLYLRINIEPDSRFALSGSDLETEVTVMPWDAALGAEIEVPAPDGSVRVKLPAGTHTGKKLKIAGRGYPQKGGGRGNLYAKVKIDIPQSLSRKQEELLSKLKEL